MNNYNLEEKLNRIIELLEMSVCVCRRYGGETISVNRMCPIHGGNGVKDEQVSPSSISDKPKYTAWRCKQCDFTIYDASEKDIADHMTNDHGEVLDE